MTALSERPLRKPKEYQRYFEVYEKALQPKMEFCRHKIIEQQVYWVGTPTSAARSVGAGRLLQIYGPLAQLVARFHGMEEVSGSIPLGSTI